ncbi:class I SAM-dependent methyltransferase [Nocardioides marmoraquaticus]
MGGGLVGVTGIDLSDGMLAEARAHAADMADPPVLLRGDMVDPPLAPGSVDAVVGRYVAWTLRSPGHAAEAWLRLLRPGGRLALVDTAWFPDGVDAPGEERPDAFRDAYDDESLAALPLAEGDTVGALQDVLRAAGFRDVAVSPLLTVRELDIALGVAPGHQVRTQFLVTARA